MLPHRTLGGYKFYGILGECDISVLRIANCIHQDDDCAIEKSDKVYLCYFTTENGAGQLNNKYTGRSKKNKIPVTSLKHSILQILTFW